MGEEEKKPEEKKSEEPKAAEKEEKKKDESEEAKKPAENNSEDTKKEEATNKEDKTPPPKPPQEIVLRVYMHCEGCARKVRRCLKGFPGVEDVMTDCKTSKVVVRGEKADPIKVLERVQRKSHRQVELISPIPKPPSEEETKKPEEEKEKPKPEEKKEEPPIVTVVLKVYMHCEACAQEIKKRILRMKGVESAEPDLKSSIVTVKGCFDPPKLVEYVHKRTGKQAVIVKQGKEDDGKKKDDVVAEKKTKGDGEEESGDGDVAASNNPEEKEKKGDENSEKKTNGDVDDNNKNSKDGDVAVTEESKVVELKRNEFNYYPPRFAMELYAYNTYPPQIFSDENPNACSVM